MILIRYYHTLVYLKVKGAFQNRLALEKLSNVCLYTTSRSTVLHKTKGFADYVYRIQAPHSWILKRKIAKAYLRRYVVRYFAQQHKSSHFLKSYSYHSLPRLNCDEGA